MHLEFTISLDDLKDLQKIALKNRPNPQASFGRGLLVWFIIVGAVLLAVWLLNSHTRMPVAPSSTPPPPPDDLSRILVPFVPWALIVGILWIFIFRHLRGAGLKKSPAYMKPVSMEIDDIGVFSSDGPTQTRWQWPAFDRVIETADRFFLRLTNSSTFVLIPKRALPNPAALEQLRTLLNHVTQGPTGAFPVLPVAVEGEQG